MGPEHIANRLAGLTQEQRKLLERLLSGKPVASAGTTAMFEEDALQAFRSPELRTKEGTRKFYNTINERLDETIYGACSAFLNYGYLENDSPQMSQIELQNHILNRNSVKLVLELIGDCDLNGRDLLDVGCGRGGTLSVINRFFDAALKVGVDLSSAAIAYCQRTHRFLNTYFCEGDAEHLPFRDGAFDVVLNVESSHSYPDVGFFYAEVWRVLLPGGYFLYTDVFPPNAFATHEDELQRIGFTIEQQRDITRNVLDSCRQNTQNRSLVFGDAQQPSVINDFLSAPGSVVFDAMESGEAVYRILKIKRL